MSPALIDLATGEVPSWTGPAHYRFAQQRLLMAWDDDCAPETGVHLVAEAGVHATLALAAATALGSPITNGMDLADYDEWVQAASETRSPAPAAPATGLHAVLMDAMRAYQRVSGPVPLREQAQREDLAEHLVTALIAAGYKDAR
ncbi:hypothetical protein GCM10009639_52220 [Kitasatospora putterlickiae]|uniref:Uncharacterized protein n=1 Tax=Kitasatospora putterlickiae TaxID=221725 RepID=A0ABP4J186_9ACTN